MSPSIASCPTCTPAARQGASRTSAWVCQPEGEQEMLREQLAGRRAHPGAVWGASAAKGSGRSGSGRGCGSGSGPGSWSRRGPMSSVRPSWAAPRRLRSSEPGPFVARIVASMQEIELIVARYTSM